MAELPRYQGGATPFQQVDPTAAKASAQMFQSLSTRLEEWNGIAYKQAQVEVAEEGQKTAINDMLSGDPLKIEKGHTFYAKAYNDISKAAYNVQVESDLKTTAEQYAAQFVNDPNGFNNAFGAYTKEALKGQTEPEFQAILKQKAMTLQGTYGAAVAKEAFKNNRENEKKALDAYLVDERNMYAEFVSNGKVEEATDSLAKISQLYALQAKQGLIHETMVPLEMKKVQKEAYTKSELNKFRKAVESGATASSLLELSNKDHSKFLTTEEAVSMRKEATSIIKQRNEAVDEAKKVDEQASLLDEAVTKRELQTKFADGKLKEDELLDLFSKNKISLKTYNEMGDLLSAGTNRFGDEKIFNELLPLALAGGLSTDKLLHNPRLSQKQISSLMKTNQQQKDENIKQAIARAQAKGGSIDAAREHIALTQEAESLVKNSFSPGRTKTSRMQYTATVNKLNTQLTELRNQAITEGKSSSWVYQETLKMIDAEKKIQEEQKKKDDEALKALQKKKPLSYNGNVTGADVFYSNLMGMGEDNA
jgi:hypothetical protein